MNKIKSLGFTIALLLIIVVLVLLRSTNKNLFKQDPKAAIEAMGMEKNVISATQLKGQYLVVDLSDEENFSPSRFKNVVNVPFNNLLDKPNRKLLEDTNEKIILYSEDIATSSKAWVILNQLDFKDIFILQTEGNTDVLKYKFQPDTLAKLE